MRQGDMSETEDKEKSSGDAAFLRSKLHVEWGYYDDDNDSAFIVVPKMPLIQAGYRQPPFAVKMWDGRVRHVLEREL
jgi:hypothetical protein